MDPIEPRSQADARQAGRLGFLDLIEGCCDAAFGGDHIGTSLENLRRYAAATGGGRGGSVSAALYQFEPSLGARLEAT